jgi:RNA polymerase sigma factor (sigma-70 family)
MATPALGAALDRLRTAIAPANSDTDGRLLGRFVRDRDEAAFAALMKRLGPMVLAVCRRACPDAHLAEDAFQAAFLVLARKADAVRPRENVAAWLYGVAYRTASKARTMLLQRRSREAGANGFPEPAAPESVVPSDDAELRQLDAAVAALPEHLRVVVVLCELEGRSRKDVAKQLGIPEGTLSSRLAKARKLLGERFRPLPLAVVPVGLATSTAKAASGGPVTESVLTLTRGAMSMLLIRKLRTPVTAALFTVAALAGTSLVAPHPVARLTAAPVPKGTIGTPSVDWKYVEKSHELSSPVLCGDKVVVGTGDGVLRAFRAKDGEPAWQYKHGTRIYHRPSADGNRVFITSSAGVTAVTAGTGEEVWRFDVKQGQGPSLTDAKLGLVYAAGENGQLYALDARSGEEKWAADFVSDAPPDRPGFPGKHARIDGTLARPTALTSDGTMLVLSVFDQSRVIAFDAKTGKRLWAFQAGGWVYGAAALTETHVCFGSQDKRLHCLDRKTGEPVWAFETGDRIECAPVADRTAVYVPACDGGLYAVSQKGGEKLWRFEADPKPDGKPTAIYSTPVLRGDVLHFAAGEGQFYAVNKSDGTQKWKIRPSEDSEAFCHAITDGTRFFVTTRPKTRRAKQPAPANPGEAALVAIGLK